MPRMPAETSAPPLLSQLRNALHTGALTPRAALEQALSRSNSNSAHNVYLFLDPERALRDADELPRRFPGAAKPPLYGLPISLKDCFDLAGFVTTAGSRFYAERNAPAIEDSAVASRLRSQGAVIIGKTHMHPLAYGITGENPDYGDCTQPNNSALLTGGSSSGAAASIQEGSAVAAIGTDTGGSIRVPAALCGLAAYRASIALGANNSSVGPDRSSPRFVGAGLTPPGVNRHTNLWQGALHLAPSFDTLGWLFRDLRDAPLLAAALFELEVPTTVHPKVRIGVAPDKFIHDAEPQVRRAFTQWQEKLREQGATLLPIDTTYWEEALSIYAPIQASEAAAIHTAETGGDFSHFEPTIAERLTWGASISPAEVQAFRQRHVTFRQQTDALFHHHDFLILPCSPIAQLHAGADHTAARKAILRYTTPFSLAGTPVITLPGPAGAAVQLTAPQGADAKLLAYAAHLGAPSES
jgi:Asp-tRNA(Asn)/Glu-tRNA(Gln) amidotransferase A subunit family amidase